MYLLGLSAFYHDSAAALIQDGKIIAAAQEERFTRIKQDASFPWQAIAFCLEEAGLKDINQVDAVVFYEDTHLKLDRILRTYIRTLPKSFVAFQRATTAWLTEKADLETGMVQALNFHGKFLQVPHHLSHAASAFYPSPFERAAVLTIDGVGEWTTTAIGVGEKNRVRLLKEIHYPHSLGMLYSAFTQYSGFRVNSDEYKLMGLAPYGQPIHVQKILDHLIDLKEDGSFKLNLKYFDYPHGFSTINNQFEKLFGAEARRPEGPIRKIDEDAAASIQAVFNDILVRLAKMAKQLTKANDLVIAGGVGLNCVSNGYLASQKIFDRVWVQPAAGDAGGALGAALYAYYDRMNHPRAIGQTDQKASLLGPSYSDEAIQHLLTMFGLKWRRIEDRKSFCNQVADFLTEEKVVGLFQGKMEFGPRALGARSILGDPRSEKMQKTMNLRIKYRESFRPFAPAVLKEHAPEVFEMDYHNPYMLFVVPVRKEKQIPMPEGGVSGRVEGLMKKLYLKRSEWPAITHVDYSARVQTVDKNENPLFYNIIEAFFEKTGCPLVINTSFNIRNEPIVCAPEDALRCFFSSDIDILILNQFIIERKDQDLSQVGRIYQEPEYLKV